MEDYRNNARGNDTGSLKNHIANYLLLNPADKLDPPILNAKLKTFLGWNHPKTAAHMLPLEHEISERNISDVKQGLLIVTARELPRFLYPDGQQYNASNEAAGLFRGHLLLRVMKHIYTSPSSVFSETPINPRAGNTRTNASIIKMTEVTPHSIAYAAVQTRFCISDVKEWHTRDRDFDYVEFYWFLIETLETPVCKPILSYFNEKLFGQTCQAGARGRIAVRRLTPAERIMAQQAVMNS